MARSFSKISHSLLRNIFCLLVVTSHVANAAELDVLQLQKDSLSTLVDLIKLDTSQPAGNEYLATDYFSKRLDAVGISYQTFEPVKGRTSLVARLKGNGKKQPILLLGHTDVVTVEPENWTFAPFSGTVAEGKIFGRGAADDKGIVAVGFELLLAVKRANITLDRDLIFLAVADEEAGGTLGITYMVEHHLKEIQAEFAINEGGNGVVNPDNGKYISFSVGTAEKTPRRARLIVKGRAGHGSVPTRDNAIGVLSRAVGRLFESPLPMALNETTRAYFSRLAATRPEAEAKLYSAILKPNPSIDVQEQLRDIHPVYFSLIRTSISPTIITGGYQRNVIPSSAEATLDIRALPGVDPEIMFDQIRAIIDDPSVEIVPMKVTRPAHLPAPLGSDLFKSFETVLNKAHPGAVILPSMSTGATDSAQLRSVGIPTYGFGPGGFLGENSGVHGNDEFLRVEPFQEYARLMWLIIKDVST